MSTLKVDAIRHNSATSDALVLSSDGSVAIGDCTAKLSSVGGGPLSHRNLIMNGKAIVFQRSLPGSVVTVDNGNNNYCMDRWYGRGEGSKGVFTFHQHDIQSQGQAAHAALRVNVTTTSTPSTDDVYKVAQRIEGRNIDGLGFGTSGAKNITLSFLTKSSVTGTHGGSIMNGSQNRAYPFTYTINSADTWEQKSITIPGDTTGTWSSGTGVGLEVNFDMGTAESNYRRPAGSWYNGRAEGADGTVQLITQSGGNWYATKIQLEVGDTATSFEHIPYADELARCQRYFYRSSKWGTASGTGYAALGINYTGYQTGNGNWIWVNVYWPVVMRAAPTVDTSDQAGNTGNKHSIFVSTGGSRTDNISNYHTSSYNDHCTVSNYWETKYGVQVSGVKADAEL